MSVRVVQLAPALEPAWERFVASHPEAGIYHSLAWKRVTEEALGHRAHYLCALDGGGEVVGVLPLFLVRGIFGRRLVSVPLRDRASVVARDEQSAAALVDASVALCERLAARYLELKAVSEHPASQLGARSWHVHRGWIRTHVDLAPGIEVLWGRLDRKALRWPIRKASKEGVAIVEDASEAGMRRFSALFLAARARMGIPAYPEKFFVALQRHVVAAGLGSLRFALLNGVPVHAAISFFSKDTTILAYTAPQETERKVYANEALVWSTIEAAAARGSRLYDFGADSELQHGLLYFKKRWGGVQERIAYHYWVREGKLPDFDSSGPRFASMRAIWRRLPRRVSRSLGAWVTRQLS